MKLTSKMKKALIGPVLLIVAITLYVCAFPFLSWYLTGLLGLALILMDLAKPITEWFDRDGLR